MLLPTGTVEGTHSSGPQLCRTGPSRPKFFGGSTGKEANSHRETNSTSLKDVCARMEKVKDQAGGSVAYPNFFGQSERRKRAVVRAPQGGGWGGAHMAAGDLKC
jgi:hypothetical protein